MAGTLYVKLDASYDDDPKIIEAGEKAELLYVRSLCLAKRILSDGFIADAHLRKFGLSNVGQRARTLVDVGLWVRDDDAKGYWIAAWLKHNKRSTDIKSSQAEASEAGTLGNHRRWHEGRDSSDPECPHCHEGDDPPDGEPESGTRSGGREHDPSRTRSPEPEPEPEPEQKPSGSQGSPDDDFSAEVCELTRLLGKRVADNGHKTPKPKTGNAYRWFEAIDKLLRIDGAHPGEVRQVIEWATSHQFWRSNILSAGKLREQYSRLRLQMQSDNAQSNGHRDPQDAITWVTGDDGVSYRVRKGAA